MPSTQTVRFGGVVMLALFFGHNYQLQGGLLPEWFFATLPRELLTVWECADDLQGPKADRFWHGRRCKCHPAPERWSGGSRKPVAGQLTRKVSQRLVDGLAGIRKAFFDSVDDIG